MLNTLFLDRDGVINRRIPDAYVTAVEDFVFYDDTKEAIAVFTQLFEHIIVVTNQQGIGKGLMTVAQLDVVHKYMIQEIATAGGRIDAVYYCPNLATENAPCRKPNPGMALQAQRDFPDIDFQQSIMVGDSLSDLQFGSDLDMMTAWVMTKKEEHEKIIAAEKNGLQIDYRCERLIDFGTQLLACSD